jgi:hypothetical protein
MATVRYFRELNVYQGAFEAAAAVFELTKRFPAAFVSKLSDADAEATETQVWFDFALQCGYIADQTHRDLSARYDHVAAQLVKMMSAPEQWCLGSAPVPTSS